MHVSLVTGRVLIYCQLSLETETFKTRNATVCRSKISLFEIAARPKDAPRSQLRSHISPLTVMVGAVWSQLFQHTLLTDFNERLPNWPLQGFLLVLLPGTSTHRTLHRQGPSPFHFLPCNPISPTILAASDRAFIGLA